MNIFLALPIKGDTTVVVVLSGYVCVCVQKTIRGEEEEVSFPPHLLLPLSPSSLVKFTERKMRHFFFANSHSFNRSFQVPIGSSMLEI